MLFCFTDCGRPLRAPLNGSFETTTTGSGISYEIILFYCDPGYILIGYPKFTCMHIGSIPTPPECRPMSALERACTSLSNPRQGRVTYYKDSKSGNTLALYTCQMTLNRDSWWNEYELSECRSTCVNSCWHPPQLLDCYEVKACQSNCTHCGIDNTTDVFTYTTTEVASPTPEVSSPTSQVQSPNSQVRSLKSQVRRLKSQVRRLKSKVRRLKSQVACSKSKV